MKTLTQLILILFFVSAVQIQKLNAQSEFENNTLVGKSALIATHTNGELVYRSSLRLMNTYNSSTDLSNSQLTLIDRTSEAASQVSAEIAALPETTLRELNEVLAIDSEEGLVVENWMLTPDEWILSK